MIPRTLTISGFLSYRQEVTLDFSRFDLACIAGANGAGKSSLLDAITWALFGQARKRDESLINMQSDAAQVTFEFEYEGNCYRVQRTNPRGKATLLEFHIAQSSVSSEQYSVEHPTGNITWKPLTERTLRATQKRIEETLRMDYETFINAAFFLQGKADQFTQQTPAKRKAILSSILGLEVWETYRQRAAEQRKAVEGEIAGLDGRLQEINAELAEESDRRARLEEIQTQLDQATRARQSQEKIVENARKIAASLEEQRKLVDALARQLENARQRLESVQQQLAERLRERETYAAVLARGPEIQAAHQAWQQARTQLAEWERTAARFQEHQARRQAPQTEIAQTRARLEAERDALFQQQARVQQAVAQRADLNRQRDEIQHNLAALDSRLQQRQELEAALQTALHEQADAKAENPRLRDAMHELKERIDQLEATQGANCPLCGQPLSSEERQRLIADLETQGKEMGDRYRANNALVKETEQKVRHLKTQIADLKSLDAEKNRLTSQLAEVDAALEQLAKTEQDWQENHLPRLESVRTRLENEDYAHEARKTLAQIDRELKEIGYDAEEHDRVRAAVQEGERWAAELSTLEKAQAALAPLEREIAGYEAQIAADRQELEARQAEHDQAAARFAAAQAQAPDLEQAQRDLLDIRQRENQLRMQFGMAQQRVAVLADLKKRRKTLEAERQTLAQQVAQYRQLERAFGKDGVPALLIEQALPHIESKANQILDRLSNGEMSVRFRTQRELKSRDHLKETLDIQISDRAGVRDYEMYSGGEAFRVNFAIRLALSEILAQRAGARLQTLVIDEGFGSQDEMGRQRLIEAINLVRPDFAKILVITHIDSLKEAFPTRIEVEKGERGSVVRVV